MYFDTHAHYDDDKFAEDRDSLINDVHAAGVDLIIDPGCDIASSKAAMLLAEKYPFIYFAAGVHPEEIENNPDDYLDIISSFASHKKCAAIGEIGLDYYWDDTHKAEQQEIFRAQLALAVEIDKPVIIHDREAHGDCLEIVKEFPALRGCFHCYSGSVEMAKVLLKAGWYLGFDGPITYKNARKAIEVLEICPMDRILIETDSPYLSPVPMRGKRNDSRNLKYVVDKIAEVKGTTHDETARAAFKNACALFSINY